METFHWKVRPDMNVVSEPKVVTVKLGDGYEQRRAAGLNNQLSTYSVTIRVRKCDHPSLKAFLERHGGVRAFQWTPPYDWKPIRVVCRKWSASVGALWVPTAPAHPVRIWGRKPHRRLITALNPRITLVRIPIV